MLLKRVVIEATMTKAPKETTARTALEHFLTSYMAKSSLVMSTEATLGPPVEMVPLPPVVLLPPVVPFPLAGGALITNVATQATLTPQRGLAT